MGKRLEQMDRVANFVQKARFQLRQAKAHADASEIMVNPAAAAPDLVAEADAALASLEPGAEPAADVAPETEAAIPAPQVEAADDSEQESAPEPGEDDAEAERVPVAA